MSETDLRRQFGNKAVDALLARILSGSSPEIDPKLSAQQFGLQPEAAVVFLDAASVAGLVERREVQACPACDEDLGARDPDAMLCPRCQEAFSDRGGIITKVVYRVGGHPPRAIPWVIVIHGFNTHGNWQQELSWRLGNKLKYSAPVLIYKYGLIRFSVLVRWRHRQLARQLGEAIRAAVAHAKANRIPEPPDVILHSFGSQLFVLLLAMPEFDDLSFGRVIAAGTVIRPNYDWSKRISQGRLEGVLCHCGGKDWAVPLAQYFIPGTGPGARWGFSDVAAINVMDSGYQHGGCFGLTELDANLGAGGLWDRFLRRHPSALADHPKRFQPKVWRPRWAAVRGLVRVTGMLLMAGLAAIVLTLASWAWLAVVQRFV